MHYFDRILTWRKIVVLRAVFFFFICGFPAHRFIGFYTTFLYQNVIFWTFKNSYRAASPEVLSYHLEFLSCCLEFLSYRLEFLSYRLQFLSLNSTDNMKLERVQERALRAIYNRKSWTYDELLKLAKLPTLKNRRLQDIAILMQKVKNELCPSYIKEIFQNNNINRHSFRNSDFVIPRFNTVTYGKHSLRYLGPFLWSN